MHVLFLFFFEQKTAYEMRIRDWSSDVCSSDLWCRFGTQDSTGLGIKIEQMSWGSWMPHKFKIAVSGCPRNCAEATIKDIGVICVDSGYELHIGGNGGIHLRGTDLLCKVETEQEALDYRSEERRVGKEGV